ncbi:1-acyl-sn-glycerol-3-phosphate acyltransferase [Prevotella conceptionensis]|uniref:1-acyl-sn-glycerol-3-phosphate acyltransferase n=1 Tax=Prevotella conceptionensis TaxID=340486 RepID=UPI0002F1D895|nr:1-acyl-sn-glycerol-3-phosphate acyltransferase [Prevotella conceptionensis]
MQSNNYLEKFAPIRPFDAEELPAAFDRLLADKQFQSVITYIFPQLPFSLFAQQLRACKNSLEVQKTFAYPFLANLLAKASSGADMDSTAIDSQRRYTFVSNHRDIVLDSAFLAKFLIDNGFSTTCEIAIGDNLLSLPWVKDLVRVNKSFIVERNLPIRQMLASSKLLSEYMHYAINEKNENVWIAQREGRAKDSNDRTQEAVLKMMAIGGEGDIVDRLADLHIVPLAISYEYDPCDFLKAKEMQQKRDTPDFKKSAQDDVLSMQTGIVGYKGGIHYHCAQCIDGFLEGLERDMSKGDLFAAVAQHIDREIYRNYRIYPGNRVALYLLTGDKGADNAFTAEEQATFEKYLEGQMAKITLPQKDETFLRQRMLEMYANPLINQRSV